MSDMTDMTDIVTMMRKVDAYHEPSEANALLVAGAQEIARLRSLGRKLALPWIASSVTATEWCEAVDAFLPTDQVQHVTTSRADLIDELADAMNSGDVDVSFQKIAAAVVDYLEKHGLLKPGD